VENAQVKIGKVLGGLVGGLAVIALVLLGIARVVGFDPGITHPGLWVRGEVVTTPVTDWTFAKKVPGPTAVQTRDSLIPGMAFSVTTSRFVHDGHLYVGSGYPTGIKMPTGRHWNKNILADPVVRIRIGDKLYDGTLVYVSDPLEHDAVLKEYGPQMWAPGFFFHMWRLEPLT
jgi:hypothetical protein